MTGLCGRPPTAALQLLEEMLVVLPLEPVRQPIAAGHPNEQPGEADNRPDRLPELDHAPEREDLDCGEAQRRPSSQDAI
jgi:hypothetical protein